MQKIILLLLIFLMPYHVAQAGIFGLPLRADISGPPLRVGVSNFLPPFVMQGAGRQLTGFDIEVMSAICKMLDRTCQFVPMDTQDVLPSIVTNRVDVGIGAITITLERYKLVNFSIPYVLSESRFLSLKNNTDNVFSVSNLNHKKVGITAGSFFDRELQLMPNVVVNVVNFKTSEDLIDAVYKHDIDFALMDNATAMYWQNHSSSTLQCVGQPFQFGFGIGIAINRDDMVLSQLINLAIMQYEKTPEFVKLYNMYFAQDLIS